MARKDLIIGIWEVVLMTWLIMESQAVRLKPQILTVRSPIYDKTPKHSFIPLPSSIYNNCTGDYEKVGLERGFNYPLHLYCLHNDPRFCLFYDTNGCLAGVQTSYLTADLRNIDPKVYNLSNHNFIKTNFFNTPAISVRIFFTNPEKLTEHIRDNTCAQIVEGLWTKLDGKIVKFDVQCQPNAPFVGDFVMQGCAPQIGQFFVRRFSEFDTCQDGFFLFMFYDQGKLVGFGHSIPGLVSPGPKITIYDYPTGITVQELIPSPPPCFYDLAKYGWTTFGIWMNEDPWNIKCPKCLCSS